MLRIVSRAARASEPSPLAISIDRVSSVRGMAEVLALPERTIRDRVLREIGLSPTWMWPTGRFRSLVS